MVKHINIVVGGGVGEVIEFNASTKEEVMEAWLIAQAYIKAYEHVIERLKRLVPNFVDEKGICIVGDHQFRTYATQKMSYDKSMLRQVFDEDTMDLFLDVKKKAVDDYIAEHLGELGEASTMLRKSMVPSGKPYSTTRVEKLY